jgi:hypothetical protein
MEKVLTDGGKMIPPDLEYRQKIVNRTYELMKQHDPSIGPLSKDFRQKLLDLINDIERSVRAGAPSASIAEACLQVAIKEFDQAPPPTYDEVVAAMLNKRGSK